MVTATTNKSSSNVVELVASSFENEARILLEARQLNHAVGLDGKLDLDSLDATLSSLDARLTSIERELQTDNDELDLRLELAWQQRRTIEASASASASTSANAHAKHEHKAMPMTAISSPPDDAIPALYPRNPPTNTETVAITPDEFNAVSTYMRGRLTLDKVNNAAKELLRHAEANRELVLALRRNQPLKSDKKHAIWLSHNIVPAIKHTGSKLFVVDTDLKQGTHLQMGSNSSRAILTILRHVGRIAETRLVVDGKSHTVYSLCSI
jgi:hypothetical protein